MAVEHAALQPSPVGIVGHMDTAIWTEKLSGNIKLPSKVPLDKRIISAVLMNMDNCHATKMLVYWNANWKIIVGLHNNLGSPSGDVYFKNTGSWYIWCWILCNVVCNVVSAYLPTCNLHAMTCNITVLVCDFHGHIDSDTVLLVLAPCESGLCWQCFWGSCCLQFQGWPWMSQPIHAGESVLRIYTYLAAHEISIPHGTQVLYHVHKPSMTENGRLHHKINSSDKT